MHFSIIMTLSLHFLLYHSVKSSLFSVIENQISISEDKTGKIFGDFFAEFDKACLVDNEPRLVMVIGASTEVLQHIQSRLTSYPYIVCTIPEMCFNQEVLNSESFFIIFLSGLDDSMLQRYLKVLSGCGTECEFLFICEGVLIDIDYFSSFLSKAIEQGLLYPAMAHLDEGAIKLYRPHMQEECLLGVKLVVIWTPGTQLPKFPFSELTIHSLKRCPIPVGTFDYRPKMVIEKNANNSLTIVEGLDGMLVLLIAKELNFTMNLNRPVIIDSQETSRKATILKEVALGRIELGIARFRPTIKEIVSITFDEECITWAVPRSLRRTKNLVWEEFPWIVWVLIALVFIVSCIIEYVHRRITLSIHINRRDSGFVTIILDVLSINLGLPVIRMPVSTGGKFMLTASLCYAVVITTAYKTSLESILTTEKSTATITDAQGIIAAGLAVGGTSYNYGILKDQADDSEVSSELVKRYIIYANESDGIHRVKFDKDVALLARRSTLNYHKQTSVENKEPIRMDILDECVLRYRTGIVFRKGSLLLRPINKLIQRVLESGITQYWDRHSLVNDKVLEQMNADKMSASNIGRQYNNIFIFYIGCILACLLIFIIELITAHFKSKRRGNIVRRNRFFP